MVTVDFADYSAAMQAVRAAAAREGPMRALGSKVTLSFDRAGQGTQLSSEAAPIDPRLADTRHASLEVCGHAQTSTGATETHVRDHRSAGVDPRLSRPSRSDHSAPREAGATTQDVLMRASSSNGHAVSFDYCAAPGDGTPSDKRRGDEAKGDSASRRAWFGGRQVPFEAGSVELRKDEVESSVVDMDDDVAYGLLTSFVHASSMAEVPSQPTTFDPMRHKPWVGRTVAARRLKRLLWLGDRGAVQPVRRSAHPCAALCMLPVLLTTCVCPIAAAGTRGSRDSTESLRAI